MSTRDSSSKRPSSVRHTRAIQRDRRLHPTAETPADLVQARLEVLIHPATCAQQASQPIRSYVLPKDQPLAETFFETRHQPDPLLPSFGQAVCGVYIVDRGFEGRTWRQHWWLDYGSQVIGRPRRKSRHAWPKPLCRWLAGLRQIVETVFDKLDTIFRLNKERPHALAGFQARLAAKVALHNFCFWLNHHLGRPSLAFAELLDW